MANRQFKIDRIARGKITDNAVDKEIDGIVKQVENKFNGVLGKLNAYDIRNFTELRTIDFDTATLGDLGNFVATMVKDLKEILGN